MKLKKCFTKTNIYNFLCNAFVILFILYPNCIILNNTKYLWLFSTIFAILILLVTNWKKKNILKNNKTIYFIIIITFLTRLIFVLKINNNVTQVSDFKAVFDMAKNFDYKVRFLQIAYDYLLCSTINGVLFKIFGYHQIVSLIFNALVTSLVSLFLYKICQKIFKNNIIGNLASILYLCWPSMLLYNAVITPDHLAMLFVVISVYLVLIIIENKDKYIEHHHIIKYILLTFLTGTSIALIGFFKNFSPILIVSIFIILCLINILNFKKYFKFSIITFFSIAFVYALSTHLFFALEENVLGAKIMHNQVGRFLYVGLGYDNNGFWDPERYNKYYDYYFEHDMNLNKTNKVFLKQLGQEINEHLGEYPRFMINKAVNNLGNEDAQIEWVVESIKANSEEFNKHIINVINDQYKILNNIFYIIIVVFNVIGAIYNVKYEKNNSLLFINILIFGSCLMLWLIETQGRYKYPVLPLYCIIAAYGIYYGYNLFRNIILRKK